MAYHNDASRATAAARTHSSGPTPASPALLVRLRVDGLDWSEHLPPVPEGHEVSVSFTRQATATRHAELLGQLGYRLVDVPRYGDAPSDEFVDMVVYGNTADDRASWWRAVSALAERIYPLALGPAAMRWRDLVAAHLGAKADQTPAHRS